jgi:hypothetical protein
MLWLRVLIGKGAMNAMNDEWRWRRAGAAATAWSSLAGSPAFWTITDGGQV